MKTDLGRELLAEMYRRMQRIRRFEDQVVILHATGVARTICSERRESRIALLRGLRLGTQRADAAGIGRPPAFRLEKGCLERGFYCGYRGLRECAPSLAFLFRGA